MTVKLVTLLLIGSLLNFVGPELVHAGNSNDSAKRMAKINKKAAKVKNAVRKLGTGKDAAVSLKLRDKTKLKGYIAASGEDDFTVIDVSGNPHVVEYTRVRQIKGNNLHAGVWVAIGVGIAVAVIFIVLKLAIDD